VAQVRPVSAASPIHEPDVRPIVVDVLDSALLYPDDLSRADGTEGKDKASRRQVFDDHVAGQRQRNLHIGSQRSGHAENCVPRLRWAGYGRKRTSGRCQHDWRIRYAECLHTTKIAVDDCGVAVDGDIPGADIGAAGRNFKDNISSGHASPKEKGLMFSDLNVELLLGRS
jgi:hypothetical protein